MVGKMSVRFFHRNEDRSNDKRQETKLEITLLNVGTKNKQQKKTRNKQIIVNKSFGSFSKRTCDKHTNITLFRTTEKKVFSMTNGS
jgi:hypothetical protein